MESCNRLVRPGPSARARRPASARKSPGLSEHVGATLAYRAMFSVVGGRFATTKVAAIVIQLQSWIEALKNGGVPKVEMMSWIVVATA